MKYFYELIRKQIGYSREGRIVLSKESKKYIKTPALIVPMKNILINKLSFLEFFEDHELFLITKEVYLKISFLKEKFKNTTFIYTHDGTIEKYKENLRENIKIFSEDNIISSIPFNIPTTFINRSFAKEEIKKYLKNAEEILSVYQTLNFCLSIRVFEYPELLNLYIPLINSKKNVRILNLVDFFDNASNYRRIIEVVLQIKQELDNNLVLMASGRIIPKFFPILIYLGIDLIDSSYLLYLSAESFYDTIEYLLPVYKIKFLPCNCYACKDKLKELLKKKHSNEKIEQLALHNLISAKTYMNKIKQYLKSEDFRAFVEKSSFDDINIVSMLRILDKENQNLMRLESPINQKSLKIQCFGPSSYYRPDFQEFRERIIKNFEPEAWTKLIILLPCSAKKPYSESKTHKKFYEIIRKFPDFPDFQEIIVTSPLGAIPRQLENIYPVNCYDISVTGDWNKEEIDVSANMLIKIIKKFNTKIPIICHFEENGYRQIMDKVISKVENRIMFTHVENNLISTNSLHSLENLIRSEKDNFRPKDAIPKNKNYLKTWHRKIIKIMDYQFGKGSGIKLIKNGIKIKKRKRNSLLEIHEVKSNKLLGTYIQHTGQIELTLQGANRLYPFESFSNLLIFDGNNIRGSTLFRPGIIDYSPNLIPNNYAFVLDKNRKKIIALVKMLVGSNYIKNTKSGRIADVYEKSE
jgi:archaeosine synthase